MLQNQLPVLVDVLLGGSFLLLLAAGLHDIAARTVPNTVSMLLAMIGLAVQAARGDLLLAVAVALLVFLLAALCWRRGWMGGGDVKLLAAAALLVQPGNVPAMLCTIAIAGGLLSVVYLALSLVVKQPACQRPRALLGRILRIERRRISRRAPLPYASAIAAGVMLSLLSH